MTSPILKRLKVWIENATREYHNQFKTKKSPVDAIYAMNQKSNSRNKLLGHNIAFLDFTQAFMV